MASVSGHTTLSVMSLLFTKMEFIWKEDCLRRRWEGGGMRGEGAEGGGVLEGGLKEVGSLEGGLPGGRTRRGKIQRVA